MENAVLPMPYVGAAADEVERHGHQLVDPRPVRVGMMPGIVLHIEADAGGRQTEEDGERERLPCRLCEKDQKDVSGRVSCEENCRFEVHLPAITRAPAGAFEK